MAIQEFSIIQQYFSTIAGNLTATQALRVLIGDDAAVLDRQAFSEQNLVVSADTLCVGTHFLENTEPEALGFKALAVNVSDILAMGAEPFAFTLCISLNSIDHSWLQRFSAGLEQAAQQYKVTLIGGDTTRGPLTISIQILGRCYGDGVCRSGAKSGDLIAVTGALGDAAAGLEILLGNVDQLKLPTQYRDYFLQKHHRPIPPNGLIESRYAQVHSAIDISDGLLQDLGHICKASNLAAQLDSHSIPLSSQLQYFSSVYGCDALRFALTGGEDYELCCTLAPEQFQSLKVRADQLGVPLSVIGTMVPLTQDSKDEVQKFVRIDNWSVAKLNGFLSSGFQHF